MARYSGEIHGKGSTGEDWFNEEAPQENEPEPRVVYATLVSVEGEEFVVVETDNGGSAIFHAAEMAQGIYRGSISAFHKKFRRVTAAWRAIHAPQ
jgi:hypothetical protein